MVSYESVVIANLWTEAWYNQKKHRGAVNNDEAIKLLKDEEKGEQPLLNRLSKESRSCTDIFLQAVAQSHRGRP